jgi:hypothetical protein
MKLPIISINYIIVTYGAIQFIYFCLSKLILINNLMQVNSWKGSI